MPVSEKAFGELMDQVRLLSARYDAQEGKMDVLGLLLTGNGDPEKGLVMKVDRLAQKAESQQWWRHTTIAAAVGALAVALASLFKTK